MKYQAVVAFNADADPEYASTTQTFTGLWSYDYMPGGFLMLNSKPDVDSTDIMLLLPARTIYKAVITIESE